MTGIHPMAKLFLSMADKSLTIVNTVFCLFGMQAYTAQCHFRVFLNIHIFVTLK